jgi:hypothetical protein
MTAINVAPEYEGLARSAIEAIARAFNGDDVVTRVHQLVAVPCEYYELTAVVCGLSVELFAVWKDDPEDLVWQFGDDNGDMSDLPAICCLDLQHEVEQLRADLNCTALEMSAQLERYSIHLDMVIHQKDSSFRMLRSLLGRYLQQIKAMHGRYCTGLMSSSDAAALCEIADTEQAKHCMPSEVAP